VSDVLGVEDFADLVGADVDEIRRYIDAGLLDPEAKGDLTGRDVLRFHYARRYVADGGDLESAPEAFRASSDPVLRRLYQLGRMTIAEAAERMGQTPEQLLSMVTGLGFDAAVFDEQDLPALELGELVSRGGWPIEATFEGVRIMGDGLSRIAASSIHLAHRYVCEAFDDADDVERLRRSESFFREYFEKSATFIYHLYVDYLTEAAVAHARGHHTGRDPDAPPGTQVATIVFADLALFSTLADLEGDEAAVALVDRTDAVVREIAVETRGDLVKHIGDEFMLIFADASAAVTFASKLRDEIREREREAAPRIGIHSGPVLYRMADYWGAAVNAASRICSMATPNSILVTEPVAKAAVDAGLAVEEIGARTLRGMEQPLTLYRIP
jgi:adenylate cyclase